MNIGGTLDPGSRRTLDRRTPLGWPRQRASLRIWHSGREPEIRTRGGNLISNIHGPGCSLPENAAERIARLAEQMIACGASGVTVKKRGCALRFRQWRTLRHERFSDGRSFPSQAGFANPNRLERGPDPGPPCGRRHFLEVRHDHRSALCFVLRLKNSRSVPAATVETSLGDSFRAWRNHLIPVERRAVRSLVSRKLLQEVKERGQSGFHPLAGFHADRKTDHVRIIRMRSAGLGSTNGLLSPVSSGSTGS